MRVHITMRKRKRCTAIVLDYFDQHGRRHQRVFGNASTPEALRVLRDKAREEAKQIELEVMQGRHCPDIGKEPIDAVLVEFIEHMECSQRKASTLRAYHDTLRKFRRFLKGASAKRSRDITPALLVQFIQWQRADNKAPDTINADLIRLQRIFRRCVDRGAMLTNPAKHPDVRDAWPRPVKHERAFSDGELERFLDTARTRHRSPDAAAYADFFLLLAETGLRLAEGRMLRWRDVSLDKDLGSYLRIEPHDGWSPKTRSSVRTVPLTPRAESMLRSRLRACEVLNPAARVFPARWTNRSVCQALNRVLSKIGLDARDDKGQKLRVHSLRHYYASRLVHNGADPATVRDLLGHESIATTNRYFATPRAELFSAVNKAFAGPRSKQVRGSGEADVFSLTAKNASQKRHKIQRISAVFSGKTARSANPPICQNPHK